MKKIISLICATITVAIFAFSATADTKPDFYINAINPGYSIDGMANVGEFIELKKSSTEPISLSGLSLRYTNGSGNSSVLFEFPENSAMIGQNLLLRLASSPDSANADLTYTKTLAFEAGPLELVSSEGAVLDSACWTGKDGCSSKFSSSKPTVLVWDDESGAYQHLEDYSPDFDEENPSYQSPPVEEPEDETVTPKCRNLLFSEILSYYELDQSEQFIEFYNGSDEDIDTDGCQINYKKKNYPLSGIAKARNYFVYFPTAFVLTKNPTSSNTIDLIDTDGTTVDSLTFYNGQKKATSYAQFGYGDTGKENWLTTYHPTPGVTNDYQAYRTCPAGKIINEDTGNCVKITTIDTLKPCPAGKYRNPLTGRCKSLETDSSSLKPCAEGYERNPETGRCRKIKSNTGADYPLSVQESGDEQTNFIAISAIIALVSLALIYIIFQFRYEIAKFFRKFFHSIRSKK